MIFMAPGRYFLLLFACSLFLFGCRQEKTTGTHSVEATTLATPTSDLVIVSTNDFHAALDRAEGLASVIRDLRQKYGEKMIYLDAGDQFQGSLEGNISKGKAVVELFNLLELDAAAMGNHELDYGPDVPKRVVVRKGEDGMGAFKKREKEAKYPFLSANFIYDPIISCEEVGPECNALGQKTVLPPYTILEKEDQKIGIIGATTETTPSITNPDFITGKTFEPPAPAITAQAKWLREEKKCDWILLAIHEGLRYEADGKTLKNSALYSVIQDLPSGIVDAIVGGHSHITVQQVINGFPIIQTGIAAHHVGVMHLSKTDDQVKVRFDPFVSVPDTAVAFDVTAMMLPYRQMALDFKRRYIARTTAPFPQDKTAESALGNLMADAVLYTAQRQGPVDFALMNAGGIRSSLPEGTVTYDNVFKLMPFANNLVIVEITGKELITLLEIGFSGVLGPPSISGLEVTTMKAPAGKIGPWSRDLNQDGQQEDWERDLLLEVKDAQGNPIVENKTYRLATNTYLAEGGDYQSFVFDAIPEHRIQEHYEIYIRDALADYFQARSPLAPTHYFTETKARIHYVNSPRPGS
jgi:5'-nucleotidase